MKFLRLLSVSVCYFSFLLYAASGFHVIYDAFEIVHYDDRLLEMFLSPRFGIGSVDENGGAIIYINLPELSINNLFSACLSLSHHNIDINKYLQDSPFSHFPMKNIEFFKEYYNTRLVCMQQGILNDYFAVAKNLTDAEIIQSLQKAISLVNMKQFQFPLPVVWEKTLILSEGSIGIGSTTEVFSVEGSKEAVKNYELDEIVEIEPDSIVFKQMAEYFEESALNNGYNQTDLSEIYHSCQLYKNKRVTQYLSLVIDEEGRIMGYLIESAQLEDAQTFLSKYRNAVLSNDYYFLNEMYELALAIEQMHKEGFLHRDIKENNIFVFKKNPKSAAISGNYYFKIADLGHMVELNTKYQSKLKINEKRRSWIPPEMYDSSLVEYTGNTTVDWYQYGYLLSEFADILLRKGGANWLQLIFSPLISCLTLQDPRVRFGSEFIKEYFTMLINQEQASSIPRNEIVTTCSIKMVNSTIFQLDQGNESLRKVSAVSNGNYFFFFVRSKLNTKEMLHVEFKQEKGNNQHIIISENYISKVVQPYRFAYFKQAIPFRIRSNMNLFQPQFYNPADSLRLDTNWNMIMIQFDGDNIDSWYYISSPKEFAILCSFFYRKMINANHDEYTDKSENFNDEISRKNSLNDFDFAILSVNVQINEPASKIKHDKLNIRRPASYKPKSRMRSERKNHSLPTAL